MIYFIRAGEGGPVKIGRAVDVKARLRCLQTGHFDVLSVIRVIDGGKAEERWLHRRFSSLRIRAEWFRFHPEMLTVSPATPSILDVAIDRGGLTRAALAAQLGVSRAAVSMWCNGITGIKPERVPAVERITGVPRHVLRPDVYSSEKAA